jgi:hypothetical protein
MVRLTISVTKKQKRDDNDNSSPALEKKVKIACICEYFAVQDQRIWEIISDEGDNF